MSDPHHPAGVAQARDAFRWPWGRSSRREYWLYMALLTAVSFLLSHAPPIMNFAFSVVMLLVQVRRVHDLGRSGWWAAAALVAPIPPSITLFYLAGEDVALAVGLVIGVVLITLIGALPGEPGVNRFGPPPPFTLRRVLTGR